MQKRLQLYYGAEYGISYISRKGEGTVATVTIPLMEEKAMKRRAGKRLIGGNDGRICALILILITIGVLQDSSQNKRTYKIIMVPKTIDESNDFWTGLIEGAKLGSRRIWL